MAGKSKSVLRKTTKSARAVTPVRMVVRRGAVERFKQLKKKTAHLQDEIVWDQREGERRQRASQPEGERRTQDRRRTPPFTWDVADFVVATPQSPKKITNNQ